MINLSFEYLSIYIGFYNYKIDKRNVKTNIIQVKSDCNLIWCHLKFIFKIIYYLNFVYVCVYKVNNHNLI